MFVLLNVMINETKDTESKCSADSYATSNTYFYNNVFACLLLTPGSPGAQTLGKC